MYSNSHSDIMMPQVASKLEKYGESGGSAYQHLLKKKAKLKQIQQAQQSNHNVLNKSIFKELSNGGSK